MSTIYGKKITGLA